MATSVIFRRIFGSCRFDLSAGLIIAEDDDMIGFCYSGIMTGPARDLMLTCRRYAKAGRRLAGCGNALMSLGVLNPMWFTINGHHGELRCPSLSSLPFTTGDAPAKGPGSCLPHGPSLPGASPTCCKPSGDLAMPSIRPAGTPLSVGPTNDQFIPA